MNFLLRHFTTLEVSGYAAQDHLASVSVFLASLSVSLSLLLLGVTLSVIPQQGQNIPS